MGYITSDGNISLPRNVTSLALIIAECNKDGPLPMRIPMEVIVFIFALPANMILLSLLLKNRKTLTPSEVLGLNFALLGVLVCAFGLTLDITFSALKQRNGLFLNFINALLIPSYFGCPLLLTCMCVERYVAVSHPVFFMKLGKWEYRATCSAIIWILSCIMSIFTFLYSLAITAVPLSIILNFMFLTMVACLLGIVRVLRQKGPGDGNQDNSSVKKRAIKNIIAVLIPSAIIYSPMLALPPYLVIIQILAGRNGTTSLLCTVLHLFGILPNFGVCIGPVFYMARVKQMLCNKNRDTRQTSTDPKNSR